MAQAMNVRNPRAYEIAADVTSPAQMLSLALGLKKDDDFVGVKHVELLANEFAREVSIGVVGIERVNLQLELVPLVRERGDLCAALVEKPEVVAPGEQSARPDYRERAKNQKGGKRDYLREPLFG